MSKTTSTYWNPLAPENSSRWTPVKGLDSMAEELRLSVDPATGEYTRLTRFHPGAETTGAAKTHPSYRGEVGMNTFDLRTTFSLMAFVASMAFLFGLTLM